MIWVEVKKFFNRSFYYSIASVDIDFIPHVTPIGSVILTAENRGYFLIKFTQKLPLNIQKQNRFCIMAVDSGAWVWIKALFLGRFHQSPALRLHCRALGDKRPATENEKNKFLEKVNVLRFFKGHDLLWSNFNLLQEFEVLKIEPVLLGIMTESLRTS